MQLASLYSVSASFSPARLSPSLSRLRKPRRIQECRSRPSLSRVALGPDAPSNSPCSEEQIFAQSLKNWASSMVKKFEAEQDSPCYAIRDYRREGGDSAVLS